DSYREVLVLRDLEELDTEQTAQHLGINSGAVKTRLHRARQALRTLLEPLVLGDGTLTRQAQVSAGTGSSTSAPAGPIPRARACRTCRSFSERDRRTQ